MKKTLVVFYSYSGTCKGIAQQYARQTGCDLMELKDLKRPGMFRALASGCLLALRGRSWAIEPLTHTLEDYDNLALFCPIWAGHTPPAVNALLQQLPGGKTISLTALSGSGNSNCRAMVEEMLRQRDCLLEEFTDQKSPQVT